MRLSRLMITVMITMGLLAGARIAVADDDSSADAAGGFVTSLDESTGLLVKVPVNERGEELVSEAETRLHFGGNLTNDSDMATAFDAAAPVTENSVVTAEDLETDSATSGWYYSPHHYRTWNHYRSHNYWSNNYYRYYSPSYFYYGNWYPYYSPYYRTYTNYHYPYNYYGHRYYYYPRRW